MLISTYSNRALTLANETTAHYFKYHPNDIGSPICPFKLGEWLGIEFIELSPASVGMVGLEVRLHSNLDIGRVIEYNPKMDNLALAMGCCIGHFVLGHVEHLLSVPKCIYKAWSPDFCPLQTELASLFGQVVAGMNVNGVCSMRSKYEPAQ